MIKGIILIFFLLCSYASNLYAQQISSDIRLLLSSEGKVFYGEEPNSIMVMDYPENLDRVTQYLNTLDVLPQQVLVEARVVEVELQGENALGVNWDLFADKGRIALGQFKAQSGAADTTKGKGAIAQGIPDKKTTRSAGSTSADNPFTISIFDENINLVLNALANVYKTDILSAPRVTTINNRPAEIKIVQSLPWAKPTVTVSDSGTSTITWDVNFESVGITLKVTPTINEGGDISMVLNPEISEKTSDYHLAVVDSEGKNWPYNIPVIDRRTASTKVIIGNGQTLIIGGLIKDKVVKGQAKVPLLGDIPVLGHLFRSKKDIKEKSELLIFVSPTVINAQEVAHMAKLEKFGAGSGFFQDKEKQDKSIRILEKRDGQYRKKLSSELSVLSKQQSALSAQAKQLEEAVLLEENNLRKLEEAKNSVIAGKREKTD